jgi:hypothetical protein
MGYESRTRIRCDRAGCRAAGPWAQEGGSALTAVENLGWTARPNGRIGPHGEYVDMICPRCTRNIQIFDMRVRRINEQRELHAT